LKEVSISQRRQLLRENDRVGDQGCVWKYENLLFHNTYGVNLVLIPKREHFLECRPFDRGERHGERIEQIWAHFY
jgi:hypothetical protein